MGKINYVNDELKAKLETIRQPVHVLQHEYPENEIDNSFLAVQDPYLQQFEPVRLKPLVVYCRNKKGIMCKYTIDQIRYISRGLPLSGGSGVAYDVCFAGEWRVLWHDKDWFFDIEEKKGEKNRGT